MLLLHICLGRLNFSHVGQFHLKLRFALLKHGNLSLGFPQVKNQAIIFFFALLKLQLHLFNPPLILANLLHVSLQMHLFDFLLAICHGI